MTNRRHLFAVLSILLAASLAAADEYLIAGTILDDAGEPLADAVATVEPAPDSLAGAIRERYLLADGPDPFADYPSATSGTDGRFELVVRGSEAEVLARNGCQFRLRLSSDGRLPVAYPLALLVRSPHADCPPPELAKLEVRFDPSDPNRVTLPPARPAQARSATVRVVGPDGEPVADARVRAGRDATATESGWQSAHASARTDEKGIARLQVPRDAAARISAFGSGTAPAATDLEADQADAELRLRSADPQRLRILSEGGPPLGDAGVCLQPGGWCAAFTDVDGLATLVRAAEPTALVIHGRDGSWSFELPARTFRGDDLAEIDLGAPRPSFDPDSGPSLVGRVTSEDGEPVAHAEVYRLDGRHGTTLNGRPSVVESAMVRTGLDGFFQIGTEDEGQRRDDADTTLEVWADGHLAERVGGLEANVAAGGVQIGPEVEIVLRRATPLEGVVRSASGEPLAGTELAVFDPDGGSSMSYPRTLSEADGSFVLRRIDPDDGGLVLYASREAYVTRQVPWHRLPEPPQPAEIILQPALTLLGRVVDPNGAPVADADIGMARGARPLAEDLFLSTGTASDGRFELEGLAPGTWHVTVEHRQFERSVHTVELEGDRESNDEVELRVEPAEIYDVAGRLAGAGVLADIELVLVKPDGPYDRSVPSATTDASGAFRFEDVRPGTYDVELVGDPRIVADDDRRLKVTGPMRLELRLARGATITGRILGLERPPDGQWLEQVSISGPGRGSVDVETATYRLEGVVAGPATVTATVEALSARADGRVDVEPGNVEVALDLDFDAGLELSGEVVRDGEPLSGALVRVQRAGTNYPYLPEGQTDEAGRFSFRGIPAGEYRIDVHRADSGGLLTSRELLLENDEVVVFEVTPSVDVAGIVVDDESGEPLSGVRVVVTREPSRHVSLLVRADLAAYTRGDGRFLFTDLPSSVDSDPWHLVAGREGLATKSLVLPEAGADDLEIRLEISHDLLLTFRSATGEVPASAVAQIFDQEGHRQAFHILQPGAGGEALLEDLPAGSWRLLVRGDDLVALVDIEVPGPDLDLVGQPGASLEVRIPELSATPRQADIELYDAQGRRLVGYPRRTEDGSILLKHQPAGLFTLRARSGERSWSRQVHLVPGDVVEVVLD